MTSLKQRALDGLEVLYTESVIAKEEYDLIAAALHEDAAPVVRGHWIKRDGYTECSECEYWYDSAEHEDAGDRTNYCPNCGARMDGGEKDAKA